MYTCNDCPRKCNAKRKALTDSGKGFCLMGENPVIARADLHFWEEPPISGTNGSGTVFFSGCNLQCVFWKKPELSRKDDKSALRFARGHDMITIESDDFTAEE